MGIQERKERQQQELRELILNTAASLFREQGVGATSMRSIAAAIEYSPGTIYRYFENKDELFYEVSRRGFRLLFSYLGSVRNIKDPLMRLQKWGEAYLLFATDYPAYYQLMFVTGAPIRALDEQAPWPEGETLREHLSEQIEWCRRQGQFRGYETEALALTLWSQAHGLVALHLHDRLQVFGREDEGPAAGQRLRAAWQAFSRALQQL